MFSAAGQTDWQGVAAVITALGVAMVALITAGATAYIKVMNEVRKNTAATFTSNGKSVGALAEEQETRRISRIPVENRTSDEVEHLVDVPLPQRPGRTVQEGAGPAT